MNHTQHFIQIDGFAFGGDAFGRLPDGKICFVRGAAPGETVEVELTHEKKKFARGRLLSIKTQSPERIAPECPLACSESNGGTDCQGCAYQHVSYEEELRWKQKQLEGFLVCSGLAAPETVLPPYPAPSRFHWRNRLKLTVGKDAAGQRAIGYLGEDNVTILPIEECPLARKDINQMIRTHQACDCEEGVRHLSYRWTQKDGVGFRTNLSSDTGRMLTERLGDFGTFQVPETGFFQTNPAVACELARRVFNAVKNLTPEFFLELFSGVGLFSILACEAGGDSLRSMGIEWEKQSVAAAKENAKERRLSARCKFVSADALVFLKQSIPKHDPASGMLLVDPPRTGLEPTTCDAIRSSAFRHVIYISCAPDTLKRDLEQICAEGLYSVVQTGLLDMFPCTSHFETMTILRLQQ